MDSVLIVGCGDIGTRVARACRERGAAVHGLVRSAARVDALAAAGVRVLRADLDQPHTLPPLPVAGTVFYFAPPPREGDVDPRLAGVLRRLEGRSPERIVYISTSGVYGDCDGAWVTEARPAAPRTPRARRRFAAETALRDWGAARGVSPIIVRVPGIYGPGRLPIERIRRGLPVLRAEESPFTNRIHADDLARACLAAAVQGAAGAVYNASDGNPTTMTDYFFRVADLCGLPRPPVVTRAEAERAISPAMRSFFDESRRLDNRRMREELGVVLRYPNLDVGLPACVGADDG